MKNILTTLCVLLLYCTLSAQNTVILNTPHSGGALSACEGFVLQPGFSFTSSANKSLSLQIDRFECTGSADNPLAHIPNKYSISTSYAVGEIPITASVSPTGSQTYTVPISVAPGINGLQPNLSLVYNSNGGNGILGQGWNISGLSAITAINSNVYYNNSTSATSLAYGPFVLDGMQIIGETTEFGNIVVKRQNISTAKYFEVLFPDGKTAIYGYKDNKVDRLSYPLTHIADPEGNHMTFSYTFENGQYYIDRIDYGASGDNDNHFATVTFSYISRPDVAKGYVAGNQIANNRLLASINTYSNNELVGTYSLNYQTKEVALLKQVDYSAGGLSLNPLVFYYGAKSNEGVKLSSVKTAHNFSSLAVSRLNICKGKFNVGNDEDAIAFYPQQAPYKWTGREWITNYSADQQIVICQNLSTSSDYGTGFPPLTTENGFVELLLADTDGITGDEVLKIQDQLFDGCNHLIVKVFRPSAITGLSPIGTKTYKLESIKQVCPKTFLVGDFEGKGRVQVLVIPHYQNSSSVDFFILNPNEVGDVYVKTPYKATISNYEEGSRFFAFDYDGDGKTELCCVKKDRTVVYSLKTYLDKNWEFKSVASTGQFFLHPQAEHEPSLLIGDINGDGNVDLLTSPRQSYEIPAQRGCCDYPSSGDICGNCGNEYRENIEEAEWIDGGDTWKMLLSNGKGEFAVNTFHFKPFTSDDHFFLQDINHDGLPDLVHRDLENIAAHFNRNGSFSSTPDRTVNLPDKYMALVSTNLNTGYQHNVELLAIGDGGKEIHRIAFNQDDGVRNRLHAVVNSMGMVSKTEYERLGNSRQNVYAETQDRYTYTFPYSGYNGPMVVVAKNESYQDNQQLSAIDYYYKDAVVHKQGLGFCGFKEIIASNRLKNNTVLTTYDPFKRGVLTEVHIPGISKTTYDYEVIGENSKAKTINLKTQTATDYLKGTTVTSSYKYDDYGNPTSEDIDYGVGLSANISIDYKNERAAGVNRIGLPLSITSTSKRNEAIWVTKKEVEYADPQHPTLPTKAVTLIVDNSQAYPYRKTAESVYEYDKFGNLYHQKEAPYGVDDYSPGRYYMYSDNGRVLTLECDKFGIFHIYKYNKAQTRLESSTYWFEGETKYEYDGLGRSTKTTYPDGTVATTGYEWTIGQVVGNTRPTYRVATSATNSPNSFTYYDGQNREVMSAYQGHGGAMVYGEKIYDSYGRISKISDPYKMGEAILYTQTKYDDFDRPTAIQHPNGGETTYKYKEAMAGQNEGYTETITQAGMTLTRIYNALGELVKASDPGGSVSYAYRADGQLESTIAPGNITTKFEYDVFGRQTKLIDPSAGTITYGYDGRGFRNLITKTRNNVTETTTIYNDGFGNPLTVTRPEYTTTYKYKADKSVESIVSTNGTAQSFKYDDFGRLTSKTDEVGSMKLEQNYRYDGNRLASTTYKKQAGTPLKTLNYGYDSYGHLSSITLDNGVVVWKLDDQNGRGQVLQETLGNGVVQTYGYTPAGAPSWRKAAKQSTLIQHFSYTLNEPKGQLTVRRDMLNQGGLENFYYDGVNRLREYFDNEFRDITYDNKGSITSKTDAGTLVYNAPGKPYAVSNLTTSSGSVPPRNQYVSYSSFDRPLTIDENSYHASFTYNASGQRAYMSITRNSLTELSRYYLGDSYELEVDASGVQTERLYLGGSAYSAPAVWEKKGTQEQLLYIHRDYLGSITHLSNEAGGKVAEYSYDAWGRMRNPKNLEPYGPYAQPTLRLGRGYTGHEHLPQFGLVNMNARLYDPVLGRFLSPDPYVSSPDFSQSFNRYIYGLNNPLSYVDQDGKDVVTILAVVGVSLAMSYLSAVKQNNWEWNPGKWNWKETQLTGGIKTDGQSVTVYGGVSSGQGSIMFGLGYNFNKNGGNVGVNVGQPGSTDFIPIPAKKQNTNTHTPVDVNLDPENIAANMLSVGGTTASTIAGLRYTASNFLRTGYWTGVNGRMYSMKLTTPGTRGYNFYQNSANIAKNSSSYWRLAGNVAGWATAAYSTSEFFKKPNWEDGLDAGAGWSSLYLYWEIGVAYGAGKIMYNGMLMNTQYTYKMGLTPGLHDQHLWRP